MMNRIGKLVACGVVALSAVFAASDADAQIYSGKAGYICDVYYFSEVVVSIYSEPGCNGSFLYSYQTCPDMSEERQMFLAGTLQRSAAADQPVSLLRTMKLIFETSNGYLTKKKLYCLFGARVYSASYQVPLTCTPDCTNRQCGDDGCGGSCGTCAIGMSCSIGGQCGIGGVIGVP